MARAIWKGAITFGLVNVPVELYPAEDRREFKLSMLDKRDFSPVGYQRLSKKSGREVPWSDVVKGYEYAKDQYVVLSDEDFRQANPKAARTIAIEAFVPVEEIPLQLYETPYYLLPTGRGGEKAYTLLRETLRATKRGAVAQVVIRTTQHLVLVVPSGSLLMLLTLRYPDELRSSKDLASAERLTDSHASAKEVELAKRLVNDLTEHWKPTDYQNAYHQDLLRRIEEKINSGQTKSITKTAPDEETRSRPADVVDLTALLRRSLSKGRRDEGSAQPNTTKDRAARRQRLRVIATRRPEEGAAAKRKRA